MSLLWTLWRWLRLPLLVLVVLGVGLLAWTVWVLTDQRYQHFLTQQLSHLLDAEVHVETSHITLWRGLGIALDNVTLQEYNGGPSLFTAVAVDVFLDLSSLLRGQFEFRHIMVLKPQLFVIEGATQEAIVRRLRQHRQPRRPSSNEATDHGAPRFTVQRLTIEDGVITYRQARAAAPLQLTALNASLVYSEPGSVTTQLEAALGPQAEFGTVTLYARTPQLEAQLPFAQQHWQGELFLANIHIQPLGQHIGETWPRAIFEFSGRYHGQWQGPIELTGDLHLQQAHIGTNYIERGHFQLEKLFWPGAPGSQAVSGRDAILRSLQMRAQIFDTQGLLGTYALPVTLQQGVATFDKQTLAVTQLQGRAGKNSQFRDGSVMIEQLFAPSDPAVSAQLSMRVDMAKDTDTILALLPPTTNGTALPQLTDPQGEVMAQLRLAGLLTDTPALQYTGEVTLRDIAFRLPTQNISVTALTGVVHVTPELVTTSALSGTVNAAPVTVEGRIHQYHSQNRTGELQLTFRELSDHTVVPLFPGHLILANNGTLSGTVNILLSPHKPLRTTGTVQLKRVQLDPLTFLHPFIITTGEVRWQEQKGTFTVTEGQLVDFAFTGTGRFASITPLRLELTLDFPTLNVQQAIDIDPPRRSVAPPKSTSVVKAKLTCGRCTYKTAQAERLHVAIHWHNRQADVEVANAEIAGGVIHGQVTVWPDLGGLFFAPQLTGINVQQFFKVLGTSTNVLTGNASGSGKVYVDDWRRWANPTSWDAVLSLHIVDGVARQVPILLRLWSALSLQGILRLQVPELPNEGLPFSSLTGDLAAGGGQIVTKNVSLNGSAVRIEASGEMNLPAQTVDLFVQLVLLHGVTSALEWVPLVGELLARGTDMFTTLPFRVTGPYTDPTVTPLIIGTG